MKSCWLLDLAERSPELALAEVAEAARQTGGTIRRMARQLCVSRRTLYRLLYRLPGGWESVNRARIEAMLARGFLSGRASL